MLQIDRRDSAAGGQNWGSAIIASYSVQRTVLPSNKAYEAACMQGKSK